MIKPMARITENLTCTSGMRCQKKLFLRSGRLITLNNSLRTNWQLIKNLKACNETNNGLFVQ